ncbi:MAG: methyltransferase [Pseudomonadota bacterium]
MAEKFFDHVYKAKTPKAVTEVYDRFAEGYDDAVTQGGYATPARLAALLARHVPAAATGPVLDFGCGTGLSGVAFAEAGFAHLHGCDPSAAMLAQAQKRGVYEKLWAFDLEAPPDAAVMRATYPVIAAVGVVSVGAAPAQVLHDLVEATRVGGHLIFSYNSHTLEDADYMTALETVLARDDITLIAREDGPHLPALGMISAVFLVHKQ